MTTPQLYATFRYQDADQALAFLRALGFTERLVVRDEQDPSVVQHAQLQWRDNGGVMLGSVQPRMHPGPTVGQQSANLVVASDAEVDATIQRALQAGGTLAQEIRENPYGGRSGLIRDPEGNHWNIDSYPGE